MWGKDRNDLGRRENCFGGNDHYRVIPLARRILRMVDAATRWPRRRSSP